MSQEMLDRILNAVIDLRVNMDRKFEQVGERFDRIENRLDRTETELELVKTAVLETGRAVKGHDERITVLEGRI